MTDDRIRRAAWVVFGIGILALFMRGADVPADPSFSLARRVPLEGFSEIAFHVTTPSGEVLDWCALLAATAAARSQGLSGQRDLRGYDAMIFQFDEVTASTFWMYRTTIPLSIAWFDEQGVFVSSSDMDPCPSTESEACPEYPAAKPFRIAVEAGQGDFGRLGIEEGSKVTLGGACA